MNVVYACTSTHVYNFIIIYNSVCHKIFSGKGWGTLLIVSQIIQISTCKVYSCYSSLSKMTGWAAGVQFPAMVLGIFCLPGSL